MLPTIFPTEPGAPNEPPILFAPILAPFTAPFTVSFAPLYICAAPVTVPKALALAAATAALAFTAGVPVKSPDVIEGKNCIIATIT